MTALLAALCAATAGAQTLDCPPGTAGSTRTCEVFHYHVAMYRPDRKPIIEVWGLNQFASLVACDRARQAYIDRNLAVVDYFKRVRNQQQWEPDRVGQCHCDRSTEPGNPKYLSDALRAQQLRNAEEIRQVVRERLLDAEVSSDADLVRGLTPRVTANALVAGPKLVPLPPPAATTATANSPNDLRATKAADVSTPATVTVDLPLVDVGGVAPVEEQPATSTVEVAVPAPPTPAPQPAPAPQPLPAPAPPPAPPPAPVQPALTPEERAAAEEAAEQFIRYETSRVQNIITAADKVSDEALKSKIFDAITIRLQVLPNLRSLIQGSGMKSRLATMARDARTEEERLALVTRLFGSEIRRHWAPFDAADVVIEPNPELEADPERILRDVSGRVSEAQRKRALYLLLAHNQPTEQQQLWLQTVIEELLR
jgi:hypothetical protein